MSRLLLQPLPAPADPHQGIGGLAAPSVDTLDGAATLYDPVHPVVSESVMSRFFQRGSKEDYEAFGIEWDAKHKRVSDVELLQWPAGQQMAMLTLRRSDISKAGVEAMKANGSIATPDDYATLQSLALAELKSDGWHKLTPQGHFQADRLARNLAKRLGLHLVTTGGDSWNDFNARCTCGWSRWLSRKEPYRIMRGWIGQHLTSNAAVVVVAAPATEAQS